MLTHSERVPGQVSICVNISNPPSLGGEEPVLTCYYRNPLNLTSLLRLLAESLRFTSRYKTKQKHWNLDYLFIYFFYQVFIKSRFQDFVSSPLLSCLMPRMVASFLPLEPHTPIAATSPLLIYVRTYVYTYVHDHHVP